MRGRVRRDGKNYADVDVTIAMELGADVVCLVRDWVPQSELVQSRLVERVKSLLATA